MTTTTTVAVGERCPTCNRRMPTPRSTPTIAPSFPAIMPAAGAEALLADHLERRERRAVKARRGRREHPDDYRLRREFPELVRFLREASAGGRITRFYAAVEPGHVVVTLAGPRGVFHPIPAVTLSAATLEALAPFIADGTVWQKVTGVAVAA